MTTQAFWPVFAGAQRGFGCVIDLKFFRRFCPAASLPNRGDGGRVSFAPPLSGSVHADVQIGSAVQQHLSAKKEFRLESESQASGSVRSDHLRRDATSTLLSIKLYLFRWCLEPSFLFQGASGVECHTPGQAGR